MAEGGHGDRQPYRTDALGLKPDIAKSETVKVLEGISDRTRMVLDIEAGFVKVWVQSWRTRTRRPKVSDTHHRLTIAFSYHQDNVFKNAHLSTESTPEAEQPPRDYVVWQWEIRHLDSDMQRFLQAFDAGTNMQVTIAITGETGEAKQRALINGWPAIINMDQTLESMALLAAAPSSAFIELLGADKNSMPVKVHRELLEKASPYFRALLSGGYAENSVLASSWSQSQLQTAKSSVCLEATLCLDAQPADRPPKRRRRSSVVTRASTEAESADEALMPEQKLLANKDRCDHVAFSEERVPCIRLSDARHYELQVLVYHIYTGLAAFTRRNNDDKPVGSISRSDPPWRKGVFPAVSAMDMYRIADLYDFESLRAAALSHIASEITTSSLLEDLKSCYELHDYPPLKRLYLEFCMKHQSELSSTSNYDDIMNYFVSGP